MMITIETEKRKTITIDQVNVMFVRTFTGTVVIDDQGTEVDNFTYAVETLHAEHEITKEEYDKHMNRIEDERRFE